MQKIVSIICAVALIGVLIFVALREKKDIDMAVTAQEGMSENPTFLLGGDVGINVVDGMYAVDTSASTLSWEAKGVGKMHTGTFPVSGELSVAGGTLAQASTLNFDINGITSTDPTGSNEQLLTHLKSADFFDVALYPTASLVIDSLVPNNDNVKNAEVDALKSALNDTAFPVTDQRNATAKGTLTMHGVTVPVTAVIEFFGDESMIQMKGGLVIDRTQWGINFNSGSLVKDLGEKLIEDEVTINFDITAKKT